MWGLRTWFWVFKFVCQSLHPVSHFFSPLFILYFSFFRPPVLFFFFGGEGVFLILVPVDCGLMEHIHFFLWHPVYQLKALSMDVVVCFCNLSSVRLRQGDHQYFEVSLGYRLGTRPDWSSVRHCLKTKNIIIWAILAKLCCYTSFLFTLLTLLVV